MSAQLRDCLTDALERMDLRMPGANGIELTRIIREHEEFHSLPAVFLSEEGEPPLRLDGVRGGWGWLFSQAHA